MGHLLRRQGVYGAPNMNQNAPLHCGKDCQKAFIILFSISITALIIVSVLFYRYHQNAKRQQRFRVGRMIDLEKQGRIRPSTSSFEENPSRAPASSMPGTISSNRNVTMPAIQTDCPEISASDRMRKMLGKEPKCRCRTCKDNPRVNPGEAYNAPYATSRGVTAHLPSPQQPSGPAVTRKVSDEVLPVYIRDDTQGDYSSPPGYPQRSQSSGSQSQYSLSKVDRPSEEEAPYYHRDLPSSRRPDSPVIRSPSQAAVRSESPMRSASGLPLNPRPGHRRELTTVGIALDDVVGGAVIPAEHEEHS